MTASRRIRNSLLYRILLSSKDAWVNDEYAIRTAIRCSAAATLGLALEQWDSVTLYFGDFSYLIPVAVIFVPFGSPRALLLRTAFLILVYSAISAAVTALAFYTIMQARQHSGDKGESYSSSASAVAGVWLTAGTFALTSKITHPEYAYPCSAGLLWTTFGVVYATRVQTLEAAWILYRQLTVSVAVGLAISLVIGLGLFPLSCRTILYEALLQGHCSMVQVLQGAKSSLEPSDEDTDEALKNLLAQSNALDSKLVGAAGEATFSQWSAGDLKVWCRTWEETVLLVEAMIGILRKSRSAAASNRTRPVDAVAPTYMEALSAQIDAVEAIDAYARLSKKPSCKPDLRGAIAGLEKSLVAIVDSKSAAFACWQLSFDCLDGSCDVFLNVLFIGYFLWSINDRLLDILTFFVRREKSHTQRQLQIPFASLVRLRDRENWNRASTRSAKHMKPETIYQIWTDKLRVLPHFLASRDAVIALRITCATMTVGIISLVPQTQSIFLDYHFVWAQYLVAMTMLSSSGQSFQKFIYRVLSTVVAVILAWFSYYAGGSTPAGSLVWYAVFLAGLVYLPTRYPRLTPAGLVPPWSLTVLLGLSLQVQKQRSIGDNHGPFLSVIAIGALRLAAICGGLVSAFFWTVFPYSLSDGDAFLSTLGQCLFSLSGYNEAAFKLLKARFEESDCIEGRKCGDHLRTVCESHRRDCHRLLAILATELRFSKLTIPIGGRFPREQYLEAVRHIADVIDKLTLLVLASSSLQSFVNRSNVLEHPEAQQNSILCLERTAERITTVLIILSNSMANSLPLPAHITKLSDPKDIKQSITSEGLTWDNVSSVIGGGKVTLFIVVAWTRELADAMDALVRDLKAVIGEYRVL